MGVGFLGSGDTEGILGSGGTAGGFGKGPTAEAEAMIALTAGLG